MNQTKVYLVGAGPGDPKLITLRGQEAIARADVIIYDRLVSPRLLKYRKSHAELVFVGKNPELHLIPQSEINELLVRFAQQGKIVTRLKGGDPSVFGRVGEEAEALVKHGISFEIVPGVTSALAVPIYAGIPVTHRDLSSSITILTGHECANKTTSRIDWPSLAKSEGTLVFLMGVANLAQIAQQLMLHGKSAHTPVALIRWGTTSAQQTLISTLEHSEQTANEHQFQAPAIILIGEVVRLREQFAWMEKKPLFRQKVLVTRATHQASELVALIEDAGGEAIEFPVISIQPMRDLAAIERIDAFCGQLAQWDWLIFTSVNGVEYFFRELRERQCDIRQLAKARIAAIGPKTHQALIDHGMFPDVIAESFQSEGLWQVLRHHVQPFQQIGIPTADLASPQLAQQLIQHGCLVNQLAIYQNKLNIDDDEQAIERLQNQDIDIVTFTSSSTVHYFIQALRHHGEENPIQLLAKAKLACIGPKTAQTLHEYGLQPTFLAREATITSLMQAIRDNHHLSSSLPSSPESS